MRKCLILSIGLLFFGSSIFGQISLNSIRNGFSGAGSSSSNSTTKNNAGTSTHDSPKFAAAGREWYVSATRGTGQLGTKKKPAKDLGNIIHHLKPNDIIYIAAGTYTSKGDMGSDEINVPVKIYGGYDETFTKRDPWGEYKTIMTGTNDYMKSTSPRIYIRTDQQREDNGQLSEGSEIVVEGLIIDNGPRNRYHEDQDLAIRRTANAPTNKNPAPESGGIVITGSKYTDVKVQHCVIMNTAPTQGALSTRVHAGGKCVIYNNLLINNTGNAIQLMTGYTGSDDKLIPKYHVQNNTTLFTWKHDAVASYGGNGCKTDQNLKVTLEKNVFAFGHMGGVYSQSTPMIMNNNLFSGNLKYDFKERNTMMNVNEILDESVNLDQNSEGNESALIQINVAERWAKIYASRQIISRADVDAAATASNSGANQLRSMLGLNLQGNDVAMDADIFLPRLMLDEGLPAGFMLWNGKGCGKPAFN